MKTISPEVLLKYDEQVPRYTSYPTAPHFSANVTDNIYQKWLKNLTDDNISIYIHIPFCRKLCWFCGCHTKITQKDSPIEEYLKILFQEMKLVSNFTKNKKIAHIHFGGGTPTILSPAQFSQVINKLKKSFSFKNNIEIALEVDPRTVGEDKIKNYAENGVNRVSLGVQDFNPQVQIAINREQPFSLVEEIVHLFRKYKINDINLDFIYGLPLQTKENMLKNLDYIKKLDPSRIALFSYAHVPWMKKHMKMIKDEDMPSATEKLKIYQMMLENFKKQGLLAIGLDHFAKKNDSLVKAFLNKTLIRNFQGYSNDPASNLIGLGISAISFLKDQGYSQNKLTIDEYKKDIFAKNFSINKGIAITEDDILRKKVIDEIMCYGEVDLLKISNKKLEYFKTEISSLKNLLTDNLIEIKAGKITINNNARQISRIVSSKFDKYLKKADKKHSKTI